MFERFTERARRVVVRSQEEARLLNHSYIGTEHILLGLVADEESIAGRVFASFGLTRLGLRSQVEEIVGAGDDPPSGHIPFTLRAKKVLELSLREAIQLRQSNIGPEHILLGLIREGEGVGSQVLVRSGADLSRLRAMVMETLESEGEGVTPTGAIAVAHTSPGIAGEPPLCPRCSASLTTSCGFRVVEATTYQAGDEPRQVVLVFCKLCGFALGTSS